MAELRQLSSKAFSKMGVLEVNIRFKTRLDDMLQGAIPRVSAPSFSSSLVSSPELSDTKVFEPEIRVDGRCALLAQRLRFMVHGS